MTPCPTNLFSSHASRRDPRRAPWRRGKDKKLNPRRQNSLAVRFTPSMNLAVIEQLNWIWRRAVNQFWW